VPYAPALVSLARDGHRHRLHGRRQGHLNAVVVVFDGLSTESPTGLRPTKRLTASNRSRPGVSREALRSRTASTFIDLIILGTLMRSGETIVSPLSGHHEARFVSAIFSAHIIEQYRKPFDLDILTDLRNIGFSSDD
jgi:hypothetical protein